MKQGDIVVRKSYGEDIRFRIERIEGDMAILRGLEVRLLADSPLSDLLLAQVSEEEAYRRWDALAEQRTQKLLESVRFQRQLYRGREASEGHTDEDTFDLPGKVLHLDGDPKYLRKCMQVYGRLKIPAEGHYLPESDMADFLGRILVVSKPDIVVITGHDGLYRNHQNKYDLASYKNSHHFVRAVQVARQ